MKLFLLMLLTIVVSFWFGVTCPAHLPSWAGLFAVPLGLPIGYLIADVQDHIR
jgi:hypothetical protein